MNKILIPFNNINLDVSLYIYNNYYFPKNTFIKLYYFRCDPTVRPTSHLYVTLFTMSVVKYP